LDLLDLDSNATDQAGAARGSLTGTCTFFFTKAALVMLSMIYSRF
jgi:hypothetical protein